MYPGVLAPVMSTVVSVLLLLTVRRMDEMTKKKCSLDRYGDSCVIAVVLVVTEILVLSELLTWFLLCSVLTRPRIRLC